MLQTPPHAAQRKYSAYSVRMAQATCSLVRHRSQAGVAGRSGDLRSPDVESVSARFFEGIASGGSILVAADITYGSAVRQFGQEQIPRQGGSYDAG